MSFRAGRTPTPQSPTCHNLRTIAAIIGQRWPSLWRIELPEARQRCCRPREHWSLWDVFPVQLHCRHQRHLVHDQVFQLGLGLHGQAFGLGKVLQIAGCLPRQRLALFDVSSPSDPFPLLRESIQRCEALWNLMAARLHPDSPPLILEACCSCNSRSPFWRSNSFTSWACDGRSAGLSSLGAHRKWRNIPVAKLKAAIWRQMRFRWFRANYWTDPLLMPRSQTWNQKEPSVSYPNSFGMYRLPGCTSRGKAPAQEGASHSRGKLAFLSASDIMPYWLCDLEARPVAEVLDLFVRHAPQLKPQVPKMKAGK